MKFRHYHNPILLRRFFQDQLYQLQTHGGGIYNRYSMVI